MPGKLCDWLPDLDEYWTPNLVYHLLRYRFKCKQMPTSAETMNCVFFLDCEYTRNELPIGDLGHVSRAVLNQTSTSYEFPKVCAPCMAAYDSCCLSDVVQGAAGETPPVDLNICNYEDWLKSTKGENEPSDWYATACSKPAISLTQLHADFRKCQRPE